MFTLSKKVLIDKNDKMEIVAIFFSKKISEMYSEPFYDVQFCKNT